MPLQLPQGVDVAPMAAGPLSGAISGTNYGNLQSTLDRNFRDSDLGYEQQLQNYQQDVAGNPNREATRQLEASKIALSQSGFDNGTQAQIAKTGAAAQVAENLAKKSDADLNTMQTHLNGAYNMDQIMRTAAGGSDDLEKKIGATLMQPSALKALKESAKRADIEFPDAIDHEYLMKIHAEASTAVNSLPMIQKALLAKQAYQQTVGTGNAAQGVGTEELKNTGALA